METTQLYPAPAFDADVTNGRKTWMLRKTGGNNESHIETGQTDCLI
jgi:hypothetical protein